MPERCTQATSTVDRGSRPALATILGATLACMAPVLGCGIPGQDLIKGTGGEELPEPKLPGNYKDVLHHTVRFFGAQRCGDGDNWTLVDNPSGDKCHTHDGEAIDAKLAGGWHDAGDFIKFTRTISWSAYALLKAYDVFPKGFGDRYDERYSGKNNKVPDVLDEVRYATDYLEKLYVDGDLIARIGSNDDHALWVTSPFQSTLKQHEGGRKRKVYENGNADLAGTTAAALALMAKLYEKYDDDVSDDYLKVAKKIYKLGLDRKKATEDNYYNDNTWRDNMLCGAIELYRATEDEDYLEDARGFHDEIVENGIGRGAPVDYTSATNICRHSLAIADKDNQKDVMEAWQLDIEGYASRVSEKKYINGLAYFGNWGSLRYTSGCAFAVALYADVDDNDDLWDFVTGQVDWILGENEYARSFVVGVGQNPPEMPHHKNSFGRDALDWNLVGDPVHPLVGALVGGPTETAIPGEDGQDVSPAGYEDEILDYVGNEVTIEYNALFVGALAATVARRDD